LSSQSLKQIRRRKLGATNNPASAHTPADPATARPTIASMTETAAPIELDGQYRAMREEAGFLGRRRSMLLVTGPDAAEYLQGQLTNDTESLDAGQGCYAALLDRKGHLQADMRLLHLEGGDLWLDLEPGPAEAVLKHLRTY